MNAFPAAGDYYKAVQAPGRCFTVPKLQAAEFVWDSLGPTLARGSSAVVFQASVQGRPQALRCYIREDASSRDRYSALDAYLAGHDLSPYVSGTTWLDGAITVNRVTWPVLTMDWIDGRTLNEYVDFLVAGSNTAALTTLAGRWRELVALLQRSEFAHGDLQHGNVMVDQDGQLRLVDFDGVWIPQLAGQSPPTEFGHPNYQHPLQHVWDRWLDTFSALVIYLSLVALGQGSGPLAGPVQLQEPAVRQERLLPPVHDRGLEAAGRAAGPAGRRARQQAAGVLRPALGLRPEPGGDPGAAGRGSGPAAGTGRPALVGAAARARRGNPGPVRRPPRRRRPGPGRSRPPPRSPRPAPGPAPHPPGRRPRAPPGSALPAPPPLSAPLGMAGTGPMPQLSQTMVPPSDTIWWTLPPAGQAQGPAGPGYRGSGYRGSAPSAPMPRGYAPHAPVPTPPGPPAPGPCRPGDTDADGAGRRRARARPRHPAAGHRRGRPRLHRRDRRPGAGAWGMWRLVTATGKGGKPPGPEVLRG